MPFFTPLWAPVPIFMLIFQLAREVWWYESPFPLNAIGYAIEPLYLRVYRSTPVLTISKSTEQDLRGLGFKGSITIIPIGIDEVVLNAHEKMDTPTFLYVGRLAPSKRIEDILEAFAQFRSATGTGALWLAGTGPHRYQAALIESARRLNIVGSVALFGRVSSSDKLRMMAEAHALLMTSVREGWGLVVTEASACGTPAIVYDVPGLHDSVRHGLTGLVVSPRPGDLATAMLSLANNPALHARLSAEGRRWSCMFSYDATAKAVEDELLQVRHHSESGATKETLGT